MKKILLPLCALLMLLLTACGNDLQGEASDILTSIPKDADAAAIINIRNITEHTDLHSPQAQARLTQYGEQGKLLYEALKKGVKPTVAGFFSRGSKMYLTGLLEDEEAFCQNMEKLLSSKFAKNGAISTCQSQRGTWVAVKGDQFWIVDRGTADADEILRYSKLTESGSYASNSWSDRLLSLDHDIAMTGDFSGMLNSNSNLGTEQRLMASMVLNTIFSDPALLALNADFSQKDVTLDLYVLNAKGNPAVLNLPMKKLNTALVTKTAPTAEAVFAVSLTQEALRQLGTKLGGIIPQKAMSGVDGTVVVASAGGTISGAVETDGSDLDGVCAFVSSQIGATPDVQGNTVFFHKGNPAAGPINLSQAAKAFDGAYLALQAAVPTERKTGISQVTVTMLPSGGSARLHAIFSGK